MKNYVLYIVEYITPSKYMFNIQQVSVFPKPNQPTYNWKKFIIHETIYTKCLLRVCKMYSETCNSLDIPSKCKENS